MSTCHKSHCIRKFAGNMPEPGRRLCASLRSRNACQHFTTRATLYGNLQEKCGAQLEHPDQAPAFTLTVRTRQRGHTVWASRGFPTKHEQSSQLKLFTRTFRIFRLIIIYDLNLKRQLFSSRNLNHDTVDCLVVSYNHDTVDCLVVSYILYTHKFETTKQSTVS